MKPHLRNSFPGKFVLLLAAIALFALSYIFNTIYTDKSAIIAERRNAENYLYHLQKDFDSFLKDTGLVIKLIEDSETEQQFKAVVSKKYGIYLYTVNNSGSLSLNFWSSQLILPPDDTYSRGDFEEYNKLANGHYLIVKRSAHIGKYTVVAYAMIPIKSRFFMETDLLSEEFFFSNTAGKRVMIPENNSVVTPFPVRSLSGKPLFYLDKKASGAVP